MGIFVGLCLLIALALPLAWSIYRSNQLFVIEVKRGRARLTAGRLPPSLLSDLSDVVSRAKIRRARLRVVKEQGRPRLLLRDGEVDAGTLQQLRNVVGRYEVQKIRTGQRRA